MEFDRVGKYKILSEIGRGTMGRVFKAQDPGLGRFVAVKTLTYSLGATEESRLRFHREAQAAALLSHPNIVTVHDFGEEKGLIFMAMELLEGKDLRDALADNDLPTLDEKLRVMEQVLGALSFAHSKGVIHRDLKPANIHIQPGGQVKIVDFGLARLPSSEMTQDGVVLGTPNYMSPEQALGDRIDARSDVFAAGAVFYEALTGKKPFDAESTPGVLYQVVHKVPAAVHDIAPDIPRILSDVVEKALAKDKNARFQSARQMHAAVALAREALEAGRGPNATLAGESSRALREATFGRSPSDSSPGSSPLVAGSAALDVTPAPAPRPRTPATLSGRERTQPTEAGRSARRPTAKSKAPLLWGVGVGVGALIAATAVGVFLWSRSRPEAPIAPPTTPASDAAKAQVGALTQALVTTQLQLAARDLDDKNYASAIDQADKILKLDPNSAEARRIRGVAVSRRQELEAAAAEAQQAADAGETEKASLALARLLDLDPRHPAAAALTEKLNSAFKTRAEEAARLAARARSDAEKAKAGTEALAPAASLAQDAEDLLRKGEYAAATRGFLEARDAFDRVRRGTPPAVASAARPSGTQSPNAAATPIPHAVPGDPASVAPPPGPAEARGPARAFVAAKTQVTSARGGRIEGFDAADVKTQRMPDFTGQIEFDTEPAAGKAGDPLVVHVILTNQGKKALRLRTINLATIVDGRRTPVTSAMLVREVGPLERVAVAQWKGVWPADTGSWALEAAITSDRNETGTNRLNWQ
jgi:serine/threonine protein kinase